VSKYNNAERTDQVTVLASDEINIAQAVVTTVATVGVIAAGVALLEIALIPGMVIGGAAVLGPRLLPNYLPKNFSGLRRRLKPLLDFSPPIASSLPKGSLQSLPVVKAPLPVQFTIKQAIAKTITYRIIVTTLDFTVNYVVIGELATAAGLSAFALVVGPLFYLAHEAVWNRFGDSDKRVDLTFLMPLRPGAETPSAEPRGFTISRALAKTVTFRTIATTMDFTTNFVVVGDLATAAMLSASGFILGPFVYLGHEMAWDYYGSSGARTSEPQGPAILLPAPG
jgi:uncharacterized membrane protein